MIRRCISCSCCRRDKILCHFLRIIVYNSVTDACIYHICTKCALYAFSCVPNLRQPNYAFKFNGSILQVCEKKKIRTKKPKMLSEFFKLVFLGGFSSNLVCSLPSYVCQNLHSEFGLVETEVHEAMNRPKLIHCSSS